jgi:hypothetical protein
MKILRLISGVFTVALLCATAASASQTPPAIDMAALQAYGPGTGAITARYGSSYNTLVDLNCAPDIPYVAWYINQIGSSTPVPYDQRLKPFTRTIHAGTFFGHQAFQCTGLAPGRYVVWIEYTVSTSSSSSGPSQAQNMNGAPPVIATNGEISAISAGRQLTYLGSGIASSSAWSGSRRWHTAPREVVVNASAPVEVDFQKP